MLKQEPKDGQQAGVERQRQQERRQEPQPWRKHCWSTLELREQGAEGLLEIQKRWKDRQEAASAT